MMVNTKPSVSMTDANRNFSKVARMVDEQDAVVILKNNTPKYVVISFDQFTAFSKLEDEHLNAVATRILNDNLKAFLELAR